MNWSRRILILVIVVALSISLQSSAAASLEISTSKPVYEYGDFLSINFQVSELTGSNIIIQISDSSDRASSPINIPINTLNYTQIAPIPFYKTTFSPGIYHIDAKYGDDNATVSFDLIDSGKIAIPTEFKTLVKTWQQGSPTDNDYAGLIRELINDNIINVANYNNQTDQVAYIPQWFKNTANLWSEDLISDNEFGSSMQYLIQKGIIII
ncbi:MAG: hypothetical protein WBV92_03515 [Nitrosotalea sp.]